MTTSLWDRIGTEYLAAYKAGDRVRVDTLRLVKAALEKVSIEKRKDRLDDAEILQVLTQQAKQRRETLEAVKASGREDIIAQTNQELAILTAYLPQQMSDEALGTLIEEAFQTAGQNQGQVMKYVMGKAGGAVDGKRVSQLVAQRLSKG
jgi:uncharacterized protein